MRLLEDAIERRLEVPDHPLRIVSLVPSVTELLFDLGAGARVVGVSNYCTEPGGGALDGIARVGGQKNPDRDAILALRPDLVIVVKEENHRRDVLALAAAGLAVYAGDVRSVEDAVGFIGEIADLADADLARAEALTARVRAGIDGARRIAGSASSPGVPIFCPVWRDPWITLSPDTYMFDALRLCGGVAVSPGRHLGRYPKVTLDAVRAARPALVLLPDEPYAFGARDAADLAAAGLAPCRFVSGKTLAWYGRRTGDLAAIAELIRAESIRAD